MILMTMILTRMLILEMMRVPESSLITHHSEVSIRQTHS